jgi:hypothetical protein
MWADRVWRGNEDVERVRQLARLCDFCQVGLPPACSITGAGWRNPTGALTPSVRLRNPQLLLQAHVTLHAPIRGRPVEGVAAWAHTCTMHRAPLIPSANCSVLYCRSPLSMQRDGLPGHSKGHEIMALAHGIVKCMSVTSTENISARSHCSDLPTLHYCMELANQQVARYIADMEARQAVHRRQAHSASLQTSQLS